MKLWAPGSEPRALARVVSGLTIAGGGLGTLNLFIDGVLRPGLPRTAYAVTMVALLLAGLALVVHPHLAGAGCRCGWRSETSSTSWSRSPSSTRSCTPAR